MTLEEELIEGGFEKKAPIEESNLFNEINQLLTQEIISEIRIYPLERFPPKDQLILPEMMKSPNEIMEPDKYVIWYLILDQQRKQYSLIEQFRFAV